MSNECQSVELFLNNFNLSLPIVENGNSSSCCTFEDGGSTQRLNGIAIGCNSGSITSINIQNQVSCQQTLPATPFELLSNLNLTGLQLSGCDLSAANSSFFDNIANSQPRLEYLNLSSSKLQSKVPTLSIVNLKNLEILDLSQNELNGYIPVSFEGLPLTYLNLSGNSFTSPLPYFPANCALMQNLKLCDLGYGCYTSNDNIPKACLASPDIYVCGGGYPTEPSSSGGSKSGSGWRSNSSISTLAVVSIAFGVVLVAGLVFGMIIYKRTQSVSIIKPSIMKKHQDQFDEDIPLIAIVRNVF